MCQPKFLPEPRPAPTQSKAKGHAGTNRSRAIPLEEMMEHFHLPITEAAQKLGVCVTVLKQQCREHGINRWPYRKVRKLDTMLHVLENTTPPEKLRPFALTNGETERKRKIDTVKDALTQLLHDPNSSAHLKLGKSRGVRPHAHRDSNSSSQVNTPANQPNNSSSSSPATNPRIPGDHAACFPHLMHQSSGNLDTSVTPQAALACLLMARGQGVPPNSPLPMAPVAAPPVAPAAAIPMAPGLHPEQFMALRLAAHRQMMADHAVIRAQALHPSASDASHLSAAAAAAAHAALPPSPHAAEAFRAQIRRLQFVDSSRDTSVNDTSRGAPSHKPVAGNTLYAKFPSNPISLSSDSDASRADEGGAAPLPELDLLSRIGSEGGCGKEGFSGAAVAAAAFSLRLESSSNLEGQAQLRQLEGISASMPASDGQYNKSGSCLELGLHSTPPSCQPDSSDEGEGRDGKGGAPVLVFGLSLPTSPSSTSSSRGDVESQMAGKRRRLDSSAAPSVAPLTPPAGGSVHSRYSVAAAAAAAAADLGLSLAVQV